MDVATQAKIDRTLAGRSDTAERGIACPSCGGHRHAVTDSRHRHGVTRRRRYCACGFRFATVELAWSDHSSRLLKVLGGGDALKNLTPDQQRLVRNLIGVLEAQA